MKLNNQVVKLYMYLFIFVTVSAFSQKLESFLPKSYNVIWNTPSKDAIESMPLSGRSGAGANVVGSGRFHLALSGSQWRV